jgi:tRNA(fMet)-specific endonuclease VapC
MFYLLDTDWIIRAITGQGFAGTTLRNLTPGQIAVSLFSVAELYEGAFNSPNPQGHLISIRHFLAPYHILAPNEPIAERFAELRVFLRRRGELIADFDTMIAATALHYDLTVLTFNLRHFQRIPDLKLYQPT